MSIYRVHKNVYNILTRSNKASNKADQTQVTVLTNPINLYHVPVSE